MRLIREVTKAMDSYDVVLASRMLMEFVADLSTWYLRESRERLKNKESNAQVSQVFGAVLKNLSLLFAPIVPFFSEVTYQNLMETPKESVHLEDWPVCEQSYIDDTLEKHMALIREVCEKTHAIRKEHAIKVRQPLSRVSIVASEVPDEKLFEVLKQEINVENIEWDKGSDVTVVELDTTVTEELKKKGEMREVMRIIQDLRKAASVPFDSLVSVQLVSWPKEYEQDIKKKTLVKELVKGPEAKLIQ